MVNRRVVQLVAILAGASATRYPSRFHHSQFTIHNSLFFYGWA